MSNIHTMKTSREPIKGDILLRHIWKNNPNECISWWRYNETIDIDRVKQYTTLNGTFRDMYQSFEVRNLYITINGSFSRDEYVTDGIEVIKATPKLVNAQGLLDRREWKKIVLTTDPDLIAARVKYAGDEFLDWFVKNPTCETAVVRQRPKVKATVKGEGIGYFANGYDIITPKKNFYCGDEVDHGEQCSFQCDGCVDATGVDYGYLPKEELKQELSVRLENSLKQFNLSLEEAINTDTYKLKEIGFGNRSITEIQNLKVEYKLPIKKEYVDDQDAYGYDALVKKEKNQEQIPELTNLIMMVSMDGKNWKKRNVIALSKGIYITLAGIKTCAHTDEEFTAIDYWKFAKPI